MLRQPHRQLLLGEAHGFQLRWVSPSERADLWERIRRRYAGPGGTCVASGPEYVGCEFEAADGSRILYLEESC
jgi:hypothetical protein